MIFRAAAAVYWRLTMPGQVGLQIDTHLSNKIQMKASMEGIVPAQLIKVYLDYCLVNHADVMRFERQVGKNITEIIEPVTALAKRPSGVAAILLKWLEEQGE
jgi:hypothetical protein